MCTFKGEFGLLMLFQSIEAIIETFFQRMALHAIRRYPIFLKFTAMIVVMTIGTGGKIDGCGKPFFMALFAVDLDMFSF